MPAFKIPLQVLLLIKGNINSKNFCLNLGALVACCIASCGELKEAVDHDPLFPHHKRIFEAVLKCLMEENDEIQYAAFCALKEVFNLNLYLSSNSFFWVELGFFALDRTVNFHICIVCNFYKYHFRL